LNKHLSFGIKRNNRIEESLVILSLSKDRQDCIFYDFDLVEKSTVARITPCVVYFSARSKLLPFLHSRSLRFGRDDNAKSNITYLPFLSHEWKILSLRAQKSDRRL